MFITQPFLLQRLGIQGAITAQLFFIKIICPRVIAIPWELKSQYSRSFGKKNNSFQRTTTHLTLHFIYLRYIIYISHLLNITYIFYTIFFFTSTTTSSSSSLSSSSPSSPPTSVSPTTLPIIPIHLSINLIYMRCLFYKRCA